MVTVETSAMVLGGGRQMGYFSTEDDVQEAKLEANPGNLHHKPLYPTHFPPEQKEKGIDL
jgi:hypothetical protein